MNFDALVLWQKAHLCSLNLVLNYSQSGLCMPFRSPGMLVCRCLCIFDLESRVLCEAV